MNSLSLVEMQVFNDIHATQLSIAGKEEIT